MPGEQKNRGNAERSAATKGQINLPTISLPRGGGAIRGIGEKFDVNPVMGTGFLNVPIFTTPSRSGFGPQLVLTYNSTSGNGPFGFGWNLSLPSITRKTDKGLPKYQDIEESDVYILSGTEDLVPVLSNQGGQWRREQSERTQEGNTFIVQRYRPRVEGLFARIERWTNKQTGDVYWRSISRDNVTAIYGKTANARISDPTDESRVFSWLICESYDDKGNMITYEYKAENSVNVDASQVHEKNRSEMTRSVNRYLKRIRYGNRTPRQLNENSMQRSDWLFEVVFDYGDHELDAPKPREERSWDVRQDVFSFYRAGFEVRTYRLCRRVLMFHHFLDELGVEDYLVRSTEFTYRESAIASFITRIIQSGYVRRDDGTYLKKSLPPLEFDYSRADVQAEIHEIDCESLENLPLGLDGILYQWVDLDGEGLSGILTEQATAWHYKPNLGGGQFGQIEVVASKPSKVSLSSGQQQLMDLAGDGKLDLVEFDSPVPGFYERTQDERWDKFKPFVSFPRINWNEPNLKFLDLTGDGHTDILIAEDEVFTWYPSLAEQGFGPSLELHKPYDEEKGPKIIFTDGAESIHLTDMNGDSLTDLVRIRNGEICYWPNLGYGHFGAKVTMDNAPLFDFSDQFDQQRIRLADIDGSGATDIIYLGRNCIRIYFNQSGNSWSETQKIVQFPHVDNLTKIMVVDLLGNGTACITWSSPLPRHAGHRMNYIDLMGGQKPHLLVGIKNNMGAETLLRYAPSTKFYLDDKAKGKPWITKIPFPVHVVERVEIYDHISQNRFVTRYSYHHGYFGIEREFLGFGRVERWDTEEFAVLQESDFFPISDNIDKVSFVSPVLTKTWFHVGASLDGNRISRQFEDEFYRDSSLTYSQHQSMLLPDTVLPFGLSSTEADEASRALKGSLLRQEIYVLDGSPQSEHPFSVSEYNYTIKMLQSQGINRHAIFFTHPREKIEYNYERNPDDPRISHSITLEVDAFGDVLKSAIVGYGRRKEEGELTAMEQAKQKQTLITYTETSFTNNIDSADNYRIPQPCEIKTYELTGISSLSRDGETQHIGIVRFSFDEMLNAVLTAESVTYETVPSHNRLEKRLIECVRTSYRKNDLSSPLPLGQLESMALPFESYKLAFTSGLLDQIYGMRATEDMLANEGGYVHSEDDSNWWIPSGQAFFSPNANDTSTQELIFARNNFFLLHRFRDPFGHTSIVEYDVYNLLRVKTIDPLGNIIVAANDYRVLQPKRVTDPNDNQAAVAFDALGFVVGTAVMGKASENKGDSLSSFEPDLDEAEIITHIQNPLANPDNILQKATTRLVYDLYAYQRTRHDTQPQPSVVYILAREIHDSDLALHQSTRIQHSFCYSDGFGHEIQKKIQAEPGDVEGISTNSRWVGSGWTIYNNKGKPVKQYEPFFSTTHQFEFAKTIGISSTTLYDPLERVIATLHPNHTYEKVVFTPWRQESWDVNDTVLQSDPKDDSDVGDYFNRLPDSEYLPTWYESRENCQRGVEEQISAQKTAEHSCTPLFAYFDALGRKFLTIVDNGNQSKYPTRIELDIEGNQRVIIDALERKVMQYDYDMLGNRTRQHSMDASVRWILNDVTGKTIYVWDSCNHRVRLVYDSLRRQTHLFVQCGMNPEKLVVRTIYGEVHPDSNAPTPGTPALRKLNLRGKVFMQLDSAGVIINTGLNPQTGEDEAYDFKGNLLRTTRQFAREYKQLVDWSSIEPLLSASPMNIPAIKAALFPLIEKDVFKSSTTYDALNRPTTLTTQDGSIIRPTYNEANLLERIETDLRGSAVAMIFINNINYNAKGQRNLVEYGNGIRTVYEYDVLTYRLIHQRTLRGTKRLQDLFYTYDPIGNITAICDKAQQTIYFNNSVVEPYAEYTYDAIYRLIRATGREHIGQVLHPTWNDRFRVNLPHPNNGQAMRRYTEHYEYDEVGNIERFTHKAQNCNWTRTYNYNEPNLIESPKTNNRVSFTKISNTMVGYAHDAHGNMTAGQHISKMDWSFKDQLQIVDRGGGGKVYYIYNAAGQRVRKVVDRQNGTRQEERFYSGSFEIYRKYDGNGSTTALERETLHIVDDTQRVALAETRTKGNDGSPAQIIRYQINNHLGSTSLELDAEGKIISYEEYYPYGGTSYQAVRAGLEANPKHYRYTGKERDEESGLYYFGERYYAPWLLRWISADPNWLKAGTNLYQYVRGNPIKRIDEQGLSDSPPIMLAPITRKDEVEIAIIGANPPPKNYEGPHGVLRDPVLNFVNAASNLKEGRGTTKFFVQKSGYVNAAKALGKEGTFYTNKIEEMLGKENIIWYSRKTDLLSKLSNLKENSIVRLTVFAHGYKDRIDLLAKNNENDKMNLFAKDFQKFKHVLSPSAEIVSHACNTGADFSDYKDSMAAEIATITQRNVSAWTGRTSYAHKDKDGRIRWIFPSVATSALDHKEILQNIKTWDIDTHFVTFIPTKSGIEIDWSKTNRTTLLEDIIQPIESKVNQFFRELERELYRDVFMRSQFY